MPTLSNPKILPNRSLTSTPPYEIRRTSLDDIDDSNLLVWHSLARRYCADDPLADPEWIRGYFDSDTANISLYTISASGTPVGVAPFIAKSWPIKWHLGELTVGSFPLTRLRLLGGALPCPPDEPLYDQLFGFLARSKGGFDAVYLEEVPIDSPLWTYIETSPLVHNCFRVYQPDPATPRPILRIQGSFEQYMGKFSPKHRKNLNRELRILRGGALGPMNLICCERPEEVPGFLERAVDVSRLTYQWKLHNRGLSATGRIERRMSFAARHGGLRSYLLTFGERAGAFAVGFQFGRRFFLHEIGFDPSLARYSVGTALLLLIIEDLFSRNSPDLVDFQEYSKYKATFSTESYLQGRAYLFRKRPYQRLLEVGDRCCRASTRALTAIMDRMDLRTSLKHRLRGWNAQENQKTS